MQNIKTKRDKQLPTFNLFVKNKYDWEKMMCPLKLKRNRWLVETWMSLYIKHPEDEFIRKLSTKDLDETKWFEKYGFKEPKF